MNRISDQNTCIRAAVRATLTQRSGNKAASQVGKLNMKWNEQPRYDQDDCLLAPGEAVMESGVYEICHSDEPRVQVLLLRDSLFPSCNRCGETVRYKLLQAAPHISEDPDFLEEPTEDNPLTTPTILNNPFPVQLGSDHGFRFWHHIVQAWRSGSDRGNISGRPQGPS